MTAYQAAKLIGCTPAQVRWLIRNDKMEAKKKPLKDSNGTVFGFEYEVTRPEAERVRKLPQIGRPRKGKVEK